MDWIEAFKLKFIKYEELKQLKANKVHCSLTINFCEGVAQSYDFKLHRRANINKINNKLNKKEE